MIFLNLLQMTILLSANLGVMNLLPLPALDGGRLVFLIVEVIRGKRVPPEKKGYVHLAGMAPFSLPDGICRCIMISGESSFRDIGKFYEALRLATIEGALS